MFTPGTAVIAYLKEPREQIWGVVTRLDSIGLMLRGIDLGSFEDFLKQAGGPEPRTISLSMVYYPSARLEKILLDEASGAIPALHERFKTRAGMHINEFIGILDGAAHGSEKIS